MTTKTKTQKLSRMAAAGLLLVSFGGLAACSHSDDLSQARVAKQPTPKLVRYNHVVSFMPGSSKLTLAEKRRLKDFVRTIVPTYGDSVVVTADATPGKGLKTHLGLADRRAQVIAQSLKSANVPVYQRDVSKGNAGASDTVSVTLRRYTVTLPNCPDFTDDWKAVFTNQPHSNWSCAMATNFGLMVANPADLVRGHDLSPGDGQRLTGAIERYRNDETKPLLGNAVSDVNAIEESDSGGGN
ncbi:MAG: hypothetical protein KIT00_10275 [Rhodospirillales bacterium]|nr:hypothetical protein [Rhodospirillales bacterium]